MTAPIQGPPDPVPRLQLPALDDDEDATRLLETLMRLQHAVRLLVFYGEFFLPGEAVEEVRRAWGEADYEFDGFIPGVRHKSMEELRTRGLAGEQGRMKRRFMNREYDGIMRHWTPKPLKRRQIERARRHMASLLEAGATVLDSIPGGSAFSELVSIFGQHVVNRMVRG